MSKELPHTLGAPIEDSIPIFPEGFSGTAWDLSVVERLKQLEMDYNYLEMRYCDLEEEIKRLDRQLNGERR